MILEGPVWIKNTNRYIVLNADGSLQLREELLNEASILIDRFNYFYQRDQLVKMCLQYFPKMTMTEFNILQKSLDYQAESIREGVIWNVRLC